MRTAEVLLSFSIGALLLNAIVEERSHPTEVSPPFEAWGRHARIPVSAGATPHSNVPESSADRLPARTVFTTITLVSFGALVGTLIMRRVRRNTFGDPRTRALRGRRRVIPMQDYEFLRRNPPGGQLWGSEGQSRGTRT